MAQQYNAEWAQRMIDNGLEKARGIMDDPAQIESLLAQLQRKLEGLPSSAANALGNIPAMASMVKSYVTREYTEVSPKVVVSLVSALLYLVKRDDLIPDSIPVVGYVDDIAIAALAMGLCEPELKAFELWRDQNGVSKTASAAISSAPIDVEPLKDES